MRTETTHPALIISYVIAAYIRTWLISSDYQEVIADHIEVSTPINSWKRVVEGLTLRKHGIDPYSGDRLHEAPFFLNVYELLVEYTQGNLKYVFIIIDILTAHFLFLLTKEYMCRLYENQEKNKSSYAKDVQTLLLRGNDFILPPYYVAAAYLFNPFTIFNCVGMTTTVYCNFCLAVFLNGLVYRNILLCSVALAIASVHSFYPVMLMVPMILQFYLIEKSISMAISSAAAMIMFIMAIMMFSYGICGGRIDFLDNTIGFILTVPDLHPNIGLFWYFFIEMFDHFRTLFIYSFQINATILYLIPLSIRFRKDPLLLAVSLLSLIAIFKSYPCIGDIGLVLSLFPLWTHLFDYMQQGFLVGVNLLVSMALGPVLWHLWIYSRSANANFYFGVTLAFAVAQIFLITDILFAYIKREFSFKFGRIRKINGEEATLVLE